MATYKQIQLLDEKNSNLSPITSIDTLFYDYEVSSSPDSSAEQRGRFSDEALFVGDTSTSSLAESSNEPYIKDISIIKDYLGSTEVNKINITSIPVSDYIEHSKAFNENMSSINRSIEDLDTKIDRNVETLSERIDQVDASTIVETVENNLNYDLITNKVFEELEITASLNIKSI